jgi:hypothetical protein
MGRVRKYDNPEEAKSVQKEQIKNSNKKYQDQRRDFKNKAHPEQLQLVKTLNKHVIEDREFLVGTLMIVTEFTESTTKTEEEKEKEGQKEEDEETETLPLTLSKVEEITDEDIKT